MQYITKDGEAFGFPPQTRKTRRAILACGIGMMIGIGLRLLLNSNPGIVTSLLSAFHAFEMMVGQVCSDIADAIGDLMEFVIQRGSGKSQLR